MKKKITAKTTKSFRILPHKFVTAIEATERKPSQLRIIQGFVGKAAKKNHIRIYLDAELRRFVDIANDNIEHYEDQRSATNPNASALIWVTETAKIQHHGHWFGTDDPTTMATGEEGGGDPTTMATGEEGAGLPNPLDALVNPFGTF